GGERREDQPDGVVLPPRDEDPQPREDEEDRGSGERAEDDSRFASHRGEREAARSDQDHDPERDPGQPGDPSIPSHVSSSRDDAHARTVPVIVVPAPGADRTVSSPPTAASRSAIPCRPVP